jgi:hypothetical protein
MDPGVPAMLKNTQKCPFYLEFPELMDPGILTPGTQTPESRGCCPPLGGNYHPGPGRGKAEQAAKRCHPGRANAPATRRLFSWSAFAPITDSPFRAFLPTGISGSLVYARSDFAISHVCLNDTGQMACFGR